MPIPREGTLRPRQGQSLAEPPPSYFISPACQEFKGFKRAKKGKYAQRNKSRRGYCHQKAWSQVIHLGYSRGHRGAGGLPLQCEHGGPERSMDKTSLPFGAKGQAFPLGCNLGNLRVSLASWDPHYQGDPTPQLPTGLGREALSRFQLSFILPIGS